RVFDEVVSLDSLVVWFVSGQFCQVQVSDGNDLEAFAFQVRNHLLESWKSFTIDGERTVVLLIVDVEINYISRDIALAKFGRDLAHSRLWVITVAALLIPQGEERR